MFAPTVRCARVICLLVLPALALHGNCLANWTIQDVDAPRQLSEASLAIDSAGRPALAYGRGELYYAHHDGADWSFEEVEDLGCRHDSYSRPGLAFDTNGDPAIAYYHSGANEIRFARRVGSEWQIQTVDTIELLLRVEAFDTSLAFDAAGYPAISYYDMGTGLRFARWDGSVWIKETVDDEGDTGRFSSLAFDAAGRPAISYHSYSWWTGTLKLARKNTVSWAIEVVDTGWGDTGCYNSLAFDSQDQPAIAYYSMFEVWYATWDGSWSTSPVDEAFSGCSLAFHEGRPYFSYSAHATDPSEYEVRLAAWDGASWAILAVETPLPYPPETTSLAFDSRGTPRIGYRVVGEVRLAREDAASWDVQTVDRKTAASSDNSLAFDDAGKPTVSYIFDDGGDTVRHARWDGLVWTSETVDDTGVRANSLAFDDPGQAAIAYQGGDWDLRYASQAGPPWDVEIVDSGENTGWFASLAFEASGDPVIAYSDRTRDELRLARRTGSWITETVDAGGDAWYVSLAIDAEGRPAMSYSLPGVKYAHWDGSWTIDSVDPDPGTSDSSLAFDPAGEPAIAYCARPDLRLARKSGADWASEEVDRIEDWPCRDASLAFHAGGHPAIAYVLSNADIGEVQLRFAYSDGITWNVETVATDINSATDVSLAIDAEGNPAIAYSPSCRGHARYATRSFAMTLYRGSVASLGSGWKVGALPLTSQNDDETLPFPISVLVPGTEQDPIVSVEPLVLYRLLGTGDTPAGNTLRVAKQPGATEIRF